MMKINEEMPYCFSITCLFRKIIRDYTRQKQYAMKPKSFHVKDTLSRAAHVFLFCCVVMAEIKVLCCCVSLLGFLGLFFSYLYLMLLLISLSLSFSSPS